MKSIINAKNALALLFLIPILTSAISFVIPNDINHKIPTIIYLCCYLISGLSCLYLAHTENKLVTNKKQKIGLYLLSFYYIICDELINRFLSIINEKYTIYNMVSNMCTEQTEHIMYTSLIYSFFNLIYIIAFLIFIWGIPTKKSTKWQLTLLFFIPSIVRVVIPIYDFIESQHLLYQTFDIACYGLMLFLVTKAYKSKININ